jgi:hypothetical protein
LNSIGGFREAPETDYKRRSSGASPVLPLVTPDTFAVRADVRGNFFDRSGPAAVSPPSTISASPVTNSESSLARNSAAPAMCSPRP